MRERANESAQRSTRIKQAGRSKRTSEQANGRASGPVLSSGFLVDLAHSAPGVETMEMAVRAVAMVVVAVVLLVAVAASIAVVSDAAAAAAAARSKRP